MKNKSRGIILVILLFCLLIPLFFYNLGGFSLIDFDEAWYAEVARNILRSGNPLILTFNGNLFLDHPPAGFNIIALSFLIFGVNDFAARFPSAVFGFLSLFLLFVIGKKLFNKIIGLSSSLILVSCVWFMFRARSGNMDTILLFFYLLTFYFGLKVIDNRKWLYALVASFSVLFLIKYMIGLTVLVPLVLYWIIFKVPFSRKTILKSLLLLIAILTPWIIANYLTYGLLYFQNMISSGLRMGTRIRPDLTRLLTTNTFVYLHFGIGKWYYPGLVSVVFSLFFIRKKKALVILYALLIVLLSGFLTNSKTEIWHLIPLYPVLALFISFTLFETLSILSHVFTARHRQRIVSFCMLYAILFVSLYQINKYRDNVRLFDKGMTDLAFVSAAAKNRPEKLYLDGHDFMPSTVYYSEKKVNFLRYNDPPQDNLKGFIASGEKNVLILTENWKLEADKIDKKIYRIITERSGRILILVI